jgi:hypothetical protein
MNLFATASRKHPISEPDKLALKDAPNEFQQKCHAFKRRNRMGRWLHKGGGPYRKPEESK